MHKRILSLIILVIWVLAGWPRIGGFPPEIKKAQASHTTTFSFGSNAEGWAYTDDCAMLNGAFTSGAGNPAGSLQTSGSKTGGSQTCAAYWEWSGTWEGLGVTAGHTVTGVSGAYDYAVSVSDVSSWDTGPFELRNSGGTLRETMVTPLTVQTGTATFANRSGSEQVFTGEASTTSIRLRINTQVVSGGGGKSWTGQNDNLAIIITHAAPPPAVSISLSTNGSVSFGTLGTNITEDTTASGINDVETVTIDSGPANLDVRSTAFSDGGTSTWSLGTSSGTDQVVWESSNNGSAWTTFEVVDTLYTLATNVSQSSTANLYLRLTTPTSNASASAHSATVTIVASSP